MFRLGDCAGVYYIGYLPEDGFTIVELYAATAQSMAWHERHK